jgi:hypothetical protein
MVVSAATCLILFAATVAFATGGTIGPGDFESGNLLPPFNSVFTRSSDMTVSNSWNIVSQDTLNPNWADFYDHTLGNAQGHFFVANGTPGVQDYMLSMTVPVTRNTGYSLTGWVAALSSDPPGALGIRIFAGAGVLKAGEFSMSSPAGVWQPFTLNFNSFNSDFLGIYFFRTQNLQTNAFALDDIQLVPEPGSAALLLIGVASCVVRRRSRS